MLEIQDKLLTNHNRPKKKIRKLKGVVIHWTANESKGADAMANRNYFNSTTRSASSHYVVDDHSIIRCIPDDEIAYHVGADSYTTLGNSIQEIVNGVRYNPNYFLIGIEMCVNSDGVWSKTYQHSVELAAYLLKKYNLTTKDLYRHYDITGKNCPAMMIKESEWEKFKEAVKKEMGESTVSTPAVTQKPTLKIGKTGKEVEELQANLNKLGYNLKVDGDFGKLTDAAVKDLQKKYGLTVDGIVGKNTYALIDRLLEELKKKEEPKKEEPKVVEPTEVYPTLKQGSKGEYVVLLQQKLKEKGYSLTIDGDFGPKTKAAVEQFQKSAGLSADGIVGPKTWSALLTNIKVEEVAKNYKAFKANKYINVVQIPLDKIKKVDIVIAKSSSNLETLSSMYSRLPEKPLVMINGGLYNIDKNTKKASSLNLLFTNDITYSAGVYSKKGFLFYPEGTVKFGEFKYTKGVQMIGGSPTIIDNGKKVVDDAGRMEASLKNSRHPRTAMGMNDQYLFIVAIDGRQTNMPGMNISELSDYMLNELKCKYAINLDGGGSTKLMLDGRVYNSPTENRAIHHGIAIYVK